MRHALSADDIDRLARKRAGAKLGWYLHATIYVVVNVGLYLLSRDGFGTRTWSQFPMLGWGLGLAIHGMVVFMLGSGSAIRERLVQKERDRLLRERGDAGR